MKKILLIVIAIISLLACKPKLEQNAKETQTEIPLKINDIQKIDVHAHYEYSRSYLPSFFNKWNMQAVLLDVAKESQLIQEIDSGARMVKVWKNFGMVTKDVKGNFIQIDDERLQPIWDFLQEQGIPVMAHIGEPKQAWRALDDPNNPHYGTI